MCSRTTKSSTYKRHCPFLLNIVLHGLVLTFLITFPKHIINKSVENEFPSFSPTTVSKLGDIFTWVITFSVTWKVQLTYLYSKLSHNLYKLISINTTCVKLFKLHAGVKMLSSYYTLSCYPFHILDMWGQYGTSLALFVRSHALHNYIELSHNILPPP